MKRNAVRGWLLLAVVLAVYNVVVFAVPFPKNGAFFVCWIFTLVSIAAQVWVVQTAFGREEKVRSRFYGFPIVRIGAWYVAVQMALSLVLMGIGIWVNVPVWVPLVLCVLLLGISAVGLIAADAVREEIAGQDEKVRKDTACILGLRQRASALSRLAKGKESAGALEKLAEAFRFSDPVSGPALSSAEVRLTAAMDTLEEALTGGEEEQAVLALAEKVQNLLEQRNELCKLHKNDR